MLKRVLALTLTMALIASMSVTSFAAAVDTSSAFGEGDVKNPLLQVEIPANFDFMVDAFNLLDPTGATGQFYSPDYFIVQKGPYNMKAVITMEAVTAEGVTLATDATTINKTDVTDKDKVAVVGGVAATAIKDGAGSDIVFAFDPKATSGDTNKLVGTYSATNATTTRVVDPDEGTGAIGFLLSAATEDGGPATPGETHPNTLAADDAGIASFRLYGEVNAYAEWQKNDIDIDFNFDFIPVVKDYYDDLVSSGTETAGLNLLKEEETVAASTSDDDDYLIKFTAAGEKTLSMPRDEFLENGKVLLAAKPATITQVKNFVSNFVFSEGTDYEYDDTTGVLTLNVAPAGDGALVIQTSAGTYLLTLQWTV